jgi:rRNA metabolism SBDS family protein
MVKVDESFEVKYKKAKVNFEVLVDFDKLNEFRKSCEKGDNSVSVFDVLADDKVFKDQKRGELASENELSTHFNTDNQEQILKTILIEGECQIPTAYKNKLRDEKKRQIVNYIVENATNPQTRGKYAATMIQGEIDKLSFNYEINKDYLPQANDILKSLRKVMPISITKSTIQMRIPGMHCGNFYGQFRRLGKTTKEKFDDHGNLCLEMEVSDSVVDRVIDEIKKNSNNEAEYVVLNEDNK